MIDVVDTYHPIDHMDATQLLDDDVPTTLNPGEPEDDGSLMSPAHEDDNLMESLPLELGNHDINKNLEDIYITNSKVKMMTIWISKRL